MWKYMLELVNWRWFDMTWTHSSVATEWLWGVVLQVPLENSTQDVPSSGWPQLLRPVCILVTPEPPHTTDPAWNQGPRSCHNHGKCPFNSLLSDCETSNFAKVRVQLYLWVGVSLLGEAGQRAEEAAVRAEQVHGGEEGVGLATRHHDHWGNVYM